MVLLPFLLAGASMGFCLPNGNAGALNLRPGLAGTAAGLAGFLQIVGVRVRDCDRLPSMTLENALPIAGLWLVCTALDLAGLGCCALSTVLSDCKTTIRLRLISACPRVHEPKGEIRNGIVTNLLERDGCDPVACSAAGRGTGAGDHATRGDHRHGHEARGGVRAGHPGRRISDFR